MLNKILDDISLEINCIQPLDELEDQHIKTSIEWIKSGTSIFRIQKPDIPPKHLVSYFVFLDPLQEKLLLVDHKKAQLWLPAGGHVEVDEHPRITVSRECREELGIEAIFWQDNPLFLTSTITVGLTAGHTDVSLWYILQGQENVTLSYDKEEFNSIRWFHLDEIPYEKSDPHMKRFVTKLKMNLQKNSSNISSKTQNERHNQDYGKS